MTEWTLQEQVDHYHKRAHEEGAKAVQAGNLIRAYHPILLNLVHEVLVMRVKLRDEGQFDLSDMFRDMLVEAGLEVNEGVDGVEWFVPLSTIGEKFKYDELR